MADRPRLKSPLDDPPSPAPVGEKPPEPEGKRFRFSIAWMLGLTLLVAFAAAGFGAMNRGGRAHAFYVIYALVTPFLALAVASVITAVKRLRRRRPPQRESDPWADC